MNDSNAVFNDEYLETVVDEELENFDDDQPEFLHSKSGFKDKFLA